MALESASSSSCLRVTERQMKFRDDLKEEWEVRVLYMFTSLVGPLDGLHEGVIYVNLLGWPVGRVA